MKRYMSIQGRRHSGDGTNSIHFEANDVSEWFIVPVDDGWIGVTYYYASNPEHAHYFECQTTEEEFMNRVRQHNVGVVNVAARHTNVRQA